MSPLLLKRLSDESLGSRLASGEAAAFDELYRRYAHRLAAYGSHLLGDAALGDDVAQATMLKAYAALRGGRLPDKMKPWLFRIAHNAAIDLVSRRREFATEHLPEQPSADREPFAGALVEALAALPDRQRRVYVLREVHGLRIDETGAELGLTAAQVEQSLFAARNRLAEQLVFGDRLNCVTVQRLAAGPLDASERRALKTHLRTCHECRGTMGLRGRALSLFPSGAGLEWLRGLGAGLIGGGAPAAAKVGAVFATATIVGGGTVAVEKTRHEPVPRLNITRSAPVKRVAHHQTALAPAAVDISADSTPVRAAVVQHEQNVERDAATHDNGSEDGHSQSSPSHEDSSQDTPSRDTRPRGDASHDGGEHASTTEKQDSSQPEQTVLREHFRTSTESHATETQPTETQPTETQPTETRPTEAQPAEPQDPPEDRSTSATSTSAEVTTPAPPDLAGIMTTGD